MWTLTFWRAVAERALKTAAQTAIATIGTTAIAADQVDWRTVGLVTATATVLSVLTSVASAVTTDGSPSLNGSESLHYEQPPTTPSGIPDAPVTPVSTSVIDGKTSTQWSDGTETAGGPTTAALS